MINIKTIKNRIRASYRNTAMQRELINALAYIRNIVILGRGNSMSGEYLMEELAENSDLLRPAFQDMGHYLHFWDKEKAGEVLYKYMRTGVSKDLGRFLAGWEDIPSAELLKTLEIYMDGLREENSTKRQKREEVLSDLVYFPVVLNAMIVLLDFLYVAFILQQQDLFKQFF